jgi:hypothetical protein
MSIYATLWRLQFPQHGDNHTGCEWVEVIAQGVPAHIGTPSPGHGYETGDPYASFLPPAVAMPPGDSDPGLRAVVLVTTGTRKGSARSGQEYVNPLLVLSGKAYATLSFGALHERICAVLRGNRPRCVAESIAPDGSIRLMFEDGSCRELGLE